MADAKPRRVGRPRVAEPQDHAVQIRLTSDEHARLAELAAADDRPLPNFIRQVLRERIARK